MLQIGTRSIVTLIAVFTLCTCIDPYSPKLNGHESFLVVDGLITDENSSYTIKLSRTIQEQNNNPVKVSDAVVFITDEVGSSFYLIAMGDGIYKTDSIEFKGLIGETYILHIITPDGNEYESEPCSMQTVPEIDSIYFTKDQELINNGTESLDGIRIFLDSEVGDTGKYYRWDYEETWKFKVPNPKRYNYVTDTLIEPVSRIKEFCWKIRKSDEVLIHSAYSDQAGPIVKKPIFFIATDKSDRLMIQYSILIRQYSLSKKEYDFWANLKRVNESGRDIFSTMPFPVISNIHNIHKPEEQVLGYFQVSAVKQKRKYILLNDIIEMNLPIFKDECERIEMAPQDYPRSPLSEPLTWDGLYEMYCITSDYYFVEPIYLSVSDELVKLVFSRPECADCEISGTLSKPDFWVDLD